MMHKLYSEYLIRRLDTKKESGKQKGGGGRGGGRYGRGGRSSAMRYACSALQSDQCLIGTLIARSNSHLPVRS